MALSQETDCIAKSYHLAEFHAQRAVDALNRMPESDSKDALFASSHRHFQNELSHHRSVEGNMMWETSVHQRSERK